LGCDGVVTVGIDACEFISRLTDIDVAVFPGELVLLSEFAADAELAFDITKQNAKHLTLLCELADDAESALEADANSDFETDGGGVQYLYHLFSHQNEMIHLGGPSLVDL
jgi:hypothetical protein